MKVFEISNKMIVTNPRRSMFARMPTIKRKSENTVWEAHDRIFPRLIEHRAHLVHWWTSDVFANPNHAAILPILPRVFWHVAGSDAGTIV